VASEGAVPQSQTPNSYTAFRYCDYDVPFWARENSRAGRWHSFGDPPTQYWSMCPEAAWAELIRAENLLSEAELDTVRMPLWVCRVPAVWLIDLRRPEVQADYGITAEEIVADDHAKCRSINLRLREDGPGILTDSAALPGHTNITLFGGKRAVDWHFTPAFVSTLATTRAAIGRPPPGLIQLVRRPAGADAQQALF
jgi:hypothetical protein